MKGCSQNVGDLKGSNHIDIIVLLIASDIVFEFAPIAGYSCIWLSITANIGIGSKIAINW